MGFSDLITTVVFLRGQGTKNDYCVLSGDTIFKPCCENELYFFFLLSPEASYTIACRDVGQVEWFVSS